MKKALLFLVLLPFCFSTVAQSDKKHKPITNISFGQIRNAFFRDILKSERYDTMYYGRGITLQVVNHFLQKAHYKLGFGTGISMATRTNDKDGYRTAQIPFYLANQIVINENEPWIPSININVGNAYVVDCKHSPGKKQKYVSMSTEFFNRLEGYVEMGVSWCTQKRFTFSASFLYMSMAVKGLQPADFHDNVMVKVGYNL